MLNIGQNIPFCLCVFYKIIADNLLFRLNLHSVEYTTWSFPDKVNFAKWASA